MTRPYIHKARQFDMMTSVTNVATVPTVSSITEVEGSTIMASILEAKN